MKKYFYLTLFFSCLVLTLQAQTDTPDRKEEGINFLDAELGEVLALAELEGKLVFLDAYTEWCAPCQKMDKEVFSVNRVGKFFNDNFVSVRINMEQGEGLEIAEKYYIFAYPSLLFLNYDGSVAHRYAGFQDDKGLLNLGQVAMDKNGNLSALAAEYESGNREADFLLRYLRASFQAADGKHIRILEKYLDTQEDWNTLDNQELIYNMLDDPQSPLFDYLVDNQEVFANTYGESNVKNKIQNMVYESLSNGDIPMSQADELFARAYPKKAQKRAAHFKMMHYLQQEQGDNFAMAAIDYVKSNPGMPSEELTDIAWNFYDFVVDTKHLKKASKWVKKLTKNDNSYYNNDLLAALYQKAGKTKKALKTARKAIAIAQQTGEDFSGTSELIRELEAQ